MINSTQFYNAAKHTLSIKTNAVKEKTMCDEMLVNELLNNIGTLLQSYIDVEYDTLTISELKQVLMKMSQCHNINPEP